MRTVPKVRAGEGRAFLAGEISFGESTPARELCDKRKLDDLYHAVSTRTIAIPLAKDNHTSMW